MKGNANFPMCGFSGRAIQLLKATEFGRTVAVNGTRGTDHGTAAAAMLLGGAVKGGRVIADWPGLSQAALLDGRDLKPTIALNALIAGAVGESIGIDPERVSRVLFPDVKVGDAITGLTVS